MFGATRSQPAREAVGSPDVYGVQHQPCVGKACYPFSGVVLDAPGEWAACPKALGKLGYLFRTHARAQKSIAEALAISCACLHIFTRSQPLPTTPC